MKNIILFIVIIFFFASLYSAEPLVKFYLQDGNTQQYNLSEIVSIGVIDKKNNYVMRIHYDDSLIAYYPTEIIGSIKFEKDSVNRDILNVYIFSYPKTYKLRSIDSLIFYIDQWQPLTIGSQVWMLKNLNVDHYQNGDSIPEVRDTTGWLKSYFQQTGAWCNYNHHFDSLGKIYGKLYNWYAVGDQKGVAPQGWHVASDAEWKALEMYLGMSQVDADYGEGQVRGTVEGGKLKETVTRHWDSPNTGATNESGFSALPGGYRFYDGSFIYLGLYGGWWSSTEFDDRFAWSRSLGGNYSTIYRGYNSKLGGESVRCVKDSK